MTADARTSWFFIEAARWTLKVSRVSIMRTWTISRRTLARWHGAESFEVRTIDGLKISALYLPGRSTQSARLPVVFTHGYCETKEFHLFRVWELCQAGHDVILFDQRAHGASGGKYVTFGVRERHDVTAVIDRARELHLVPDRVITMGFSLGASVMLQHAGSDPRVAGVVALAPFVSGIEAINSFRRMLAPWLKPDEVLAGFEYASREAGFVLDEASTIRAIERLRVPVLMAVGDRDRNLPGDVHSKVLAGAMRQHSCRLIEVRGATHLSLARRLWPELDPQIIDFCGRLR